MSTTDLNHVSTAGKHFVASQAVARDGRGIRAIRLLEEALVEALRVSGTGLRGAPNLNPAGDFFAGYCVRGNPKGELPKYHARLVLATDGHLVLASTDSRGHVHIERATDDVLKLEDLEAIADRIHSAIKTHVEKCEVAVQRNHRLSTLASRIESVLAA